MSTYDDASLIYYPSGYKAGTAYSLKPTDGSGDLTFTRASTATRVNESGLIEEVAANVPRLDNSQGGCSTLLLEPQRTNVIKQSQDYTTGDYIFSNITSINTNFATSPSGVLNSQKVNFGTGSSYLRSKESLASALSCSIFAKYVDYPYLQIMIGGDSEHYANFDVQNGTIGNVGTKSTASIEDYGDGWYRIVINSLSGTFGSAPRIYKIENLLASWALGGGAAGSCLLWGFQYELGSYATSYIPTTSTAVTRVKDETSTTIIPTMTGVSEFTWFFDNTDMDVLVGIVVYMQLNLSGGALRYYSTNGGRFRGSTYFGDVNAIGKLAVKCDGTTLTMFKNGVKSASTLPSALGTFVDFSGFNQGGESFSGGMQSMMLFPTALSDAELIALTTI